MIKNNLSISCSLYDAIKAIESSDKRLAVVLSDDKHILGTLTDGDVRRHILNNKSLDDRVSEAMNKNPVICNIDTSDSELKKVLLKNNIRSLPLSDNNGKYVRTLHENELFFDSQESYKDNFSIAVIMAGGEGRRLRPLTEDMPKPMVDINGIPLLERQIRKLSKMGVSDIYISVNYLGNIIEEYFKEGDAFGVNIRYLNETKKLGTAGALALLPNINKTESVLVMNGDVLTSSDFINLYHFYKEQKSIITISAIDYNIKIPFGVIQLEGSKVNSIQEKPSQHFFCNAGIYALSANAISMIPKDKYFDMTDLIEKCIKNNDHVSVFPVHEFWSDIGTIEDLNNARKKFHDGN